MYSIAGNGVLSDDTKRRKYDAGMSLEEIEQVSTFLYIYSEWLHVGVTIPMMRPQCRAWRELVWFSCLPGARGPCRDACHGNRIPLERVTGHLLRDLAGRSREMSPHTFESNLEQLNQPPLCFIARRMYCTKNIPSYRIQKTAALLQGGGMHDPFGGGGMHDAHMFSSMFGGRGGYGGPYGGFYQ